MVKNVTKLSEKMKSKILLSKEKKFIECEKMFYYNYKNAY